LTGSPTFLDNTMNRPPGLGRRCASVTLAISGMNGNGGATARGSTRVRFRVLQGDVNASGTITAADVSICKTAVSRGLPVNGSIFRCDVDLNGILTTADLNLVKAQSSGAASVRRRRQCQYAADISSIAPQTAISGPADDAGRIYRGRCRVRPGHPVGHGCFQRPVDRHQREYFVWRERPLAHTFAGTVAGLTNVSTATITVTVSDGIAQTPTSFTLTVVPPSTFILATLQPISGVNSLGSGTATLSVSGDLTYAILKYSFSNLAGADSDERRLRSGRCRAV